MYKYANAVRYRRKSYSFIIFNQYSLTILLFEIINIVKFSFVIVVKIKSLKKILKEPNIQSSKFYSK